MSHPTRERGELGIPHANNALASSLAYRTLAQIAQAHGQRLVSAILTRFMRAYQEIHVPPDRRLPREAIRSAGAIVSWLDQNWNPTIVEFANEFFATGGHRPAHE